MPELAKLIEVERRHGSVNLKIDGEEFPWFVSLDGVSANVRKDECPAVTVTILADQVRVLDSVATPCEGEGPLSLETLEVATTPGLTHLELARAGVSLCGIELFPAGDQPQPLGFSRGGGRSDWSTPCPDCLRLVSSWSRDVKIEGIHAPVWEAALRVDRGGD